MATASHRPASVRYEVSTPSPTKQHSDRHKSAPRLPAHLPLVSLLNTLRAANSRKKALLASLRAEADARISSDEEIGAKLVQLEEMVRVKETAVAEAATQQAQLVHILHRTAIEATNCQQRFAEVEKRRVRLEALVRPVGLDTERAERKAQEVLQRAATIRASTETHSARRAAKLEELRGKQRKLTAATKRLVRSFTARDSAEQVTGTQLRHQQVASLMQEGTASLQALRQAQRLGACITTRERMFAEKWEFLCR